MKLYLAVLLLAAVVHYVADAQYWGYNDDYAYDDTGIQMYDSEYTLVPVQVLPNVYDDAPIYQREARGKKGKKKKGKKKKGKKGWGWGWPKIKHIWLKAPKFWAHPPVVHIHPAPKHHVHKVVHGWGHGGGGGYGGYKK